MNTNLCLIDYELNHILFDGIGKRIEEEKFILYEFGDKNHLYKWKIYGKGLIIESISDVKVHLPLIQDKNTKGYIETEFGKLEIECSAKYIKIESNKIEVQYTLNEQDFHFVLKGGLRYGIH